MSVGEVEQPTMSGRRLAIPILTAAGASALLVVIAVLLLRGRSGNSGGETGLRDGGDALRLMGIWHIQQSEAVRSFDEFFNRATPDARDYLVLAPNPFPSVLPEGRRYGRILNLLLEGEKPIRVPLLWEEEPNSDGDTNVLFYDGHFERMPMSELESLVEEAAWLPRGPDGAVPDEALVRDEKRPQELIDKEVEAQRWAFAGFKQYTSPPNVYRPTGKPPDWDKVREDKVAGHPDALFAVIGMTEREITRCLGPPCSSQDYGDEGRALIYDYGFHDPEGPRIPLSLWLIVENGRCDHFFIDD